jgi:hypothetical protein
MGVLRAFFRGQLQLVGGDPMSLCKHVVEVLALNEHGGNNTPATAARSIGRLLHTAKIIACVDVTVEPDDALFLGQAKTGSVLAMLGRYKRQFRTDAKSHHASGDPTYHTDGESIWVGDRLVTVAHLEQLRTNALGQALTLGGLEAFA